MVAICLILGGKDQLLSGKNQREPSLCLGDTGGRQTSGKKQGWGEGLLLIKHL